MVLKFIQLQGKGFFRSASLGKEVGVKIFMGFIILYFAITFLAMGIMLYPAIEEQVDIVSPMQYVNQFIAIWLLIELIVRFLLQTLPVMNVRPLMTTTIKKSNIIHFLLFKSIFSFFNWIAPMVVIPFGMWCIYKEDYSVGQIVGWWVTIFALMLCMNFINFIMSKKSDHDVKWLIPFILVPVILYLLEKFDVFSVTRLTADIMEKILTFPILSSIPLCLLVILYYLNFKHIKNTFYLDTSFKDKADKVAMSDLSWTSKFGDMAKFLQMDIRLIWRNKRPKATIWMALLFAAYGLLFYGKHDMNSFYSPFLGIFMTGIFVINFGQFIPAWDSSYYPLLMTQKTSIRQYLNSKVGLMYLSIVVMTMLTLPYAYFGVNIMLLNIACAIYNAGINIPVILYASSYNKKRIELDKSAMFNTQGAGATQWLIGLPLLILPLMIWLPLKYFFNEWTATTILAVAGIIGLLLKNIWLNFIVKGYTKRKYAMIDGFKQIN